jgi:NADH-ubiquinone oxidoreductase chain 5
VGLFVGSINFMVIIPNRLFFLIGWDGLGVISFVLVIYYQNNVSLCGGIMTCLSNRVGDVFLIVSLIVLGSCGR